MNDGCSNSSCGVRHSTSVNHTWLGLFVMGTGIVMMGTDVFLNAIEIFVMSRLVSNQSLLTPTYKLEIGQYDDRKSNLRCKLMEILCKVWNHNPASSIARL